jgi:hypothetical protein
MDLLARADEVITRNRQEREHVTARERSDERFLGIDIGGAPRMWQQKQQSEKDHHSVTPERSAACLAHKLPSSDLDS